MRLAAVLAAVLVTAACAGSNGGEATPGGPEGVLFQYRFEGGFVPVSHMISASPAYTVTVDGKLITQGMTDLRWPGPLMPTFFWVQLTPGEMRQFQAMIERMGLPGITEESDETGKDQIADANTDVIVYWDSNGQHRYSAYAPGLLGTNPTGKTADLLEIRNALERVGYERTGTPFEPTRVRVIVGDDAFVDPDFAEVQEWPLADTDLDQWVEIVDRWVCRSFGPEILPTFAQAHQAMLWKSPDGSGALHSLYVRPLLPGEPDCPGF